MSVSHAILGLISMSPVSGVMIAEIQKEQDFAGRPYVGLARGKPSIRISIL